METRITHQQKVGRRPRPGPREQLAAAGVYRKRLTRSLRRATGAAADVIAEAADVGDMFAVEDRLYKVIQIAPPTGTVNVLAIESNTGDWHVLTNREVLSWQDIPLATREEWLRAAADMPQLLALASADQRTMIHALESALSGLHDWLRSMRHEA
jgi:hypothetical protein